LNSSVTHEAETLLDIFRNGKAILLSVHVGLLCETIDFIRHLLATLEQAQSDSAYGDGAKLLTDKFKAVINDLRCGSVDVQSVTAPPASAEAVAVAESAPLVSAPPPELPRLGRLAGVSQLVGGCTKYAHTHIPNHDATGLPGSGTWIPTLAAAAGGPGENQCCVHLWGLCN